jgi:hypothetical protein
MGDEAVKPTRHGRMPRAGTRDNDLTVLTPPVGLPATPEAASGHPLPATEGGHPVEAQAEPPGAAGAPGRCLCGHPRSAHEHYRRGSDCGICGVTKCATYRRPRGVLRRMLGRVLSRRGWRRGSSSCRYRPRWMLGWVATGVPGRRRAGVRRTRSALGVLVALVMALSAARRRRRPRCLRPRHRGGTARSAPAP